VRPEEPARADEPEDALPEEADRAAPVPTPQPELPSEPALAHAPRTTGPDAPRVAPSPEPVWTRTPAPSEGRDEPVRVAVVPTQPRSRTLYRGPDEPSHSRIARAAEAVEGGQTPWDDPPTGIELR